MPVRRCKSCQREFKTANPFQSICPDCRDKSLDLGCAGYGWLRPEGVRRELEKMAAVKGNDA